MASGTVKWFNTAKGFGFVQPDDGGSDVFIHISALNQAGLDSLDEGDKVDYELEQDRRSGKLAATQIVVTEKGAPQPRRSGGGGGFPVIQAGVSGSFRRRCAMIGDSAGSTATSGCGCCARSGPTRRQPSRTTRR